MNIAHIGLASCFTYGMTYQDNQLAHQNSLDGHNVLYISNSEKYQDGKIVNTGYENVILPDGVRLIRLPYCNLGSSFLSCKIRKVSGLYDILENFSPNVILSHNLSYESILDVVHYKKKHPFVKLYADTHTADYNSGRNWVSLHILHRTFYKYLIRKAIPYLEKYFYVGESERIFNIENYGIPEEIMEFYPLGGNPFSEDDYNNHRRIRRQELGIGDNEILFIHSGKLQDSKRTRELLEAFSSVPGNFGKLAIIGSIPEDQKPILQPLIDADERIVFLGWKTGEELQEYLCACDLYCQPGSVSATMQNAVCCNCAIMAYPHLPYTKDLDWGNILWVKTEEDMKKVFLSLAERPEQLIELKKNSKRCAEELLDYRNLAARLYE